MTQKSRMTFKENALTESDIDISNKLVSYVLTVILNVCELITYVLKSCLDLLILAFSN